jgi:hypothetical protein
MGLHLPSLITHWLSLNVANSVMCMREGHFFASSLGPEIFCLLNSGFYVLQDAYSPHSSSPMDPLGGYITMIQHGTGISKFSVVHGGEYSGSGLLI